MRSSMPIFEACARRWITPEKAGWLSYDWSGAALKSGLVSVLSCIGFVGMLFDMDLVFSKIPPMNLVMCIICLLVTIISAKACVFEWRNARLADAEIDVLQKRLQADSNRDIVHP